MKKNWKVWIALSLALVLALSACGKKPAETTSESAASGEAVEAGTLKGEITVQAEEGWVEYYQKAIDKIVAANPEAKITIKQAGAFDHLDIISNTDATNADVADVFAIPVDRFSDLAGNDVLAALPAKEMAEALGGFTDYDKGLGGNLKDGDSYLAFPFNIETLVTFVNTKNAEAEGIDASKPLEMTEQKKAATILLQHGRKAFSVYRHFSIV